MVSNNPATSALKNSMMILLYVFQGSTRNQPLLGIGSKQNISINGFVIEKKKSSEKSALIKKERVGEGRVSYQ